MPLGENAQGGTLGSPEPLAQPGPSPDTGKPPVVLVACTANALVCRIASGLFHFSASNDGVVVRGPICNLLETCPPRAVRICARRHFVDEQLHRLNGEILDYWCCQVPG